MLNLLLLFQVILLHYFHGHPASKNNVNFDKVKYLYNLKSLSGNVLEKILQIDDGQNNAITFGVISKRKNTECRNGGKPGPPAEYSPTSILFFAGNS